MIAETANLATAFDVVKEATDQVLGLVCGPRILRVTHGRDGPLPPSNRTSNGITTLVGRHSSNNR